VAADKQVSAFFINVFLIVYSSLKLIWCAFTHSKNSNFHPLSFSASIIAQKMPLCEKMART